MKIGLVDFQKINADKNWSFTECTQKQTRYLTHSYHTYPAKFIPQLAAKLIKELSQKNEIIVDPFMGSGTTVVEALLQERISVGVDINPIATLIAKVKSTPLEPMVLKQTYNELIEKLLTYPKLPPLIPQHERLDYWFPQPQQEQLGAILNQIDQITLVDIKDFFLVAFSQILKSCSIWLQKSVKPCRDTYKILPEPINTFLRHARYMMKRNTEFYSELLPRISNYPLEQLRITQCTDARCLPVETQQASLIVTSPPYVTSYEYADLHQLTAFWLKYCESLAQFRRPFIGSAYAKRDSIDLQSTLAKEIGEQLGNNKKAQEVRHYFADMLECFQEMQRVLKPGGKACIVIGNTKLNGVPILNAEVFGEQMRNIGFTPFKVIKREISSKMLPQTRDPNTGRFTAAVSQSKVLAYPVEYILIMEKV